MKFDGYQKDIEKTAYWPKNHGLLYLSNALGGEAGELQNIVKKMYRDRGGIIEEDQRNQIISELGDVLWYVAAISSELGIKLSDVAYENRLKAIQKKIKSATMTEEEQKQLTEKILRAYNEAQKEKEEYYTMLMPPVEPLDRKGSVG